jgi:hypothetical protein
MATLQDRILALVSAIGADNKATTSALDFRLRIDAPQSLTTAQKAQGKTNLDGYGTAEFGNYDLDLVGLWTTAKGETLVISHGVVPLGANDVFRSAPISTSGKSTVTLAVSSDQSFSVRLDTSTDGVNFTTGTTLYNPTLSGSSYDVNVTVSVATTWTRLSITAGSITMTRLSATTTTN